MFTLLKCFEIISNNLHLHLHFSYEFWSFGITKRSLGAPKGKVDV